MTLSNATDPFGLFLETVGRTPAFRGTPRNYTVEQFSYGKGYGLVAALNIVKLPTGYTLLWNVQAQTADLFDYGTTLQTFFAPNWYTTLPPTAANVNDTRAT